MAFIDTLYSLLPYIIGVIVIFVGWKMYKSYSNTAQEPEKQVGTQDTGQQQEPEPPAMQHPKEGDSCSKCNKGTVEIFDTDESINLACNMCNTLYMQWPLVK